MKKTAEQKQLILEKKVRRSMKIARCRPLKNFGWWLLGFFTSAIVAVSSVIAVTVFIPLGTLTKDDSHQIFDEELGNQTLINFILNYKQYSFASLPGVKTLLEELVKQGDFGRFVAIDYDKLDQISFGDFDLEYVLTNCVEVVATMNSIGILDSLGSIGELKTLTTSTPVEGEVDPKSPDFKPALYYFYPSSGRLSRAFTDDGEMVLEAVGQQLYYPALGDVPVTSLFSIFEDRIGMESVGDLLCAFSDFEEDSPIIQMFDGLSVEELGSFDPMNVLLSTVLEINQDNEMIYKILCSSVIKEGGVTPETLLIGDLSHLDVGRIHLVDVLPPNEDNADFYSTMRAATGVITNEEITISMLMEAKMGDVTLTCLLDYEGNETLFGILSEATGKNELDITIQDLYEFDFRGIRISSLTNDLGDDLKELLVSACGVSSFEALTLQDLDSFETNRIPLSLIIKNDESNSKLISILMQATGCLNYENLTIGSLTSFSLDNVLLSTLLPTNDILFDILSQATGIAPELLKISNLGSFDISSVSLSTLIKESTGNAILDAVLKDDTVTVGNLGEKLNSLSLNGIYGEKCFTTDETKTFLPGDHYEKIGDSYVYDDDGDYEGDYYVSIESGIMLFYAWGAEDISPVNGRPGRYVPTSISLANFESIDCDTIKDATIYECLASGIVDPGDYSDAFTRLTLRELIQMAAALVR